MAAGPVGKDGDCFNENCTTARPNHIQVNGEKYDYVSRVYNTTSPAYGKN